MRAAGRASGAHLYVLPLPVCPYAKTVPLKPSSTLSAARQPREHRARRVQAAAGAWVRRIPEDDVAGDGVEHLAL